MLKSVRVKRILTLALSLLVLSAVVVAGVMFSDTDKSKDDVLGGGFESVKLAASAEVTASDPDAIFNVTVKQEAINKITVTGTVDRTMYNGNIAIKIGTDMMFSQIFTVTDDNGVISGEYEPNKTFAREYGNELPVFICYGDKELSVGTVGVITYDYDSGILGYPEGTVYINATTSEQLSLTKAYVPTDAIDADGNATVIYQTNIIKFKANPKPVADAPEVGTDGIFDQIGVDTDNDGEIDKITAYMNTTEGRQYAIVLVDGSIGSDYGIDAWISAEEAKEISGLELGAKYSIWVRVAGDAETFASAPVYLGAFEAMDPASAEAKAKFIAKYEEVTATKKLYDSVDPEVTATPDETDELCKLYDAIPDVYKNAKDLAAKGKYLVLSNFLANYQELINDTKNAKTYDDLSAYTQAQMKDACDAFSDIYVELGEMHLSDATDAEFIIELSNTVAKLYALSDITEADAAKDEKYEVIHYFYESVDDDRATANERYESIEFLISTYLAFRDEYEIGLFMKKYDVIAVKDLDDIDTVTLEAMFADLKDVDVFDDTGFGVYLVDSMARGIYAEIIVRYQELIAAIDDKTDEVVIVLKEDAEGAFEQLATYLDVAPDVFALPNVKTAIYDVIVEAINTRFAQLDAIDTVTALKNGTEKIDGIADGYLAELIAIDVLNANDLAVVAENIALIVDKAEKEVAFELAIEKAYADINAMKDGTPNVDGATVQYLEALDMLSTYYDYANADEFMEIIEMAVSYAKSETDFEKAHNAAKAELIADVTAKKASNRYSEYGASTLDKKLVAAITEINKLAFAEGKKISDIEALVAAAKADFNTVDIVIITVGEGEYAEAKPDKFNFRVLNNKGMSSALEISVKLAATKSKISGTKVSVAAGEFTDALAQAAVDNKKVVLSFNITSANATKTDGLYTVKILLPKSLRAENGLQVVTEDGDKVYLYETVKAGAYLVFETANLDGDYHVLADKSVNLLWLVVVLAVLLVVEIAVVAYVIIKKKKKNVTAVFVPFLAVLYTPAGIVPAAITLGVVAAVGAITSSAVVVKSVKDEKKNNKEITAQPVAEVKPEATEPEVVAESEVVAEPEVVVEPEVVAEPEVVVEPETVTIVKADLEKEDEEVEPVAADETGDNNTEDEVGAENDTEEEAAEEVKVFSDENGEKVYVTYDYSFRSKLMLGASEAQTRYALISDMLLSYGIKSRESWKKERYFYKGTTYASLVFRGKTLCVYLAISPESLEGTKYFFENVSGVKKYEATPVMVRVRSARGCKYVCELIKMMCEGAGLVQKRPASDEFKYKSGTLDEIIEMGYIKVLMTSRKGTFTADFKQVKEIADNTMSVYSSITVEDAANVPDERVQQFVQTEEIADDSAGSRKGTVNIDDISAAFNAGDVVTLQSLIEKKLLPKNTNYVKVLAAGTLDKALTVKANDFSMDAVKMIIMTGGSVVKIKIK